MIIKVLSLENFKQEFKNQGRENQFSDWALEELYSHIISRSDELTEAYELDIIELCCTYSEENKKDLSDSLFTYFVIAEKDNTVLFSCY